MKFVNSLGIALLVLSTSTNAQFCPLPQTMPSESEQDELFVKAMFEVDYVFRGRLFTFYDDNCDGDICTWNSLVFKVNEDIRGFSNPYVEGDWVEDCERLWLHPSEWRTDKDKTTYKVDKEYLILANETDTGIEILGSRLALKINELKMRYELERITVK